MMIKGKTVVYSRIKQLKSITYYETENQCLPKWLNQFVRIEKDRGFHNGKPSGKHFEDWLKVKHPILNFKKGCQSTGLLKTHRENFFNGDFLVNGQRIRLTIEFGNDRELLAITVH
jgi:hypothetical protein